MGTLTLPLPPLFTDSCWTFWARLTAPAPEKEAVPRIQPSLTPSEEKPALALPAEEEQPRRSAVAAWGLTSREGEGQDRTSKHRSLKTWKKQRPAQKPQPLHLPGPAHTHTRVKRGEGF